MQDRKKICKHWSFTLIELLIVVAIIAILAGMILPALNSALESARKAQCQSNYKQVLLAVHQYVDDYKGIMPVLLTIDGEQYGWSHFLWNRSLRGNVRNLDRKVFHCPSLKLHPDTNHCWYYNGMLGHYGDAKAFIQSRYGVSSYYYKSDPRNSYTNFKGMTAPTKYPLFSDTQRSGADSIYPNSFFAPKQSGDGAPSLHHRRTGVIGFADGHVASYGPSWYANEGFEKANINGVNTNL